MYLFSIRRGVKSNSKKIKISLGKHVDRLWQFQQFYEGQNGAQKPTTRCH